MFFSELHVGNLCPDLLFFLVSFAVLSSTDVKRTTCEEGYKKASIYLLQPPRFLLTAMASLGKYIMSSNYNYTRDRNVCQGWPFYKVKCLCSRGWEWGRQGDQFTTTKGQIISKCLIGVFNFFQKRTKTRRIVVKMNSFI